MPKVGSKYTCLAVILIDRVLKNDESCYLQLVFKKCKYIDKEKSNDKIYY